MIFYGNGGVGFDVDCVYFGFVGFVGCECDCGVCDEVGLVCLVCDLGLVYEDVFIIWGVVVVWLVVVRFFWGGCVSCGWWFCGDWECCWD